MIAIAKELVQLLEGTAPLSEEQVSHLYEAHQKARRIDFLAPENVQKEQLSCLEDLAKNEASSELSTLWNQSLSTEKANDLVLHLKLLIAFFNKYLASGEVPPPASAWRVTVILRKEKEIEIDRRFLQGWCKHFGSSRGVVYEKIAKRLQQ
ncbi:hypothetical protein [Pseudoxanthomonas wuyuanensis]